MSWVVGVEVPDDLAERDLQVSDSDRSRQDVDESLGSRVALRDPLGTVTVINVLMIPKAATTMIRIRMKNIIVFSTWIAPSKRLFNSAQVCARKGGRSVRFSSPATAAAPITGSSVITSIP